MQETTWIFFEYLRIPSRASKEVPSDVSIVERNTLSGVHSKEYIQRNTLNEIHSTEYIQNVWTKKNNEK